MSRISARSLPPAAGDSKHEENDEAAETANDVASDRTATSCPSIVIPISVPIVISIASSHNDCAAITVAVPVAVAAVTAVGAVGASRETSTPAAPSSEFAALNPVIIVVFIQLQRLLGFALEVDNRKKQGD